MAYSIYLCSGIIFWQYYTELLLRTQNVLLEQSALLKKVNFPKSTLPVYILISSSINFLILLVIFVGFLILTGRGPNAAILALFPLIVLQQGFALGLGIILGTLNVFFRDIAHAMSIIIQFWFWFTPIVYPFQIVPDSLKWIFQWNPLVPLFQSYQNIFLYGFWPIWSDLFPIFLCSLLFLITGFFTYKKLINEAVDEL